MQALPWAPTTGLEASLLCPRTGGRSYTDHVRPRSVPRLAVLAVVAAFLSGCGTDGGDDGSPVQPLQLRLVTSSASGPCDAPAPTSDGPASACDWAGTTTYELGESLGVITPTSAVRSTGQGPEQVVVALELDEADAGTLGDVTADARQQHLAMLLDGRVISAALVMDPVTTGRIELALGTGPEAGRIVARLGASEAP
jgi:hypothetical protein